MTKTKKRKYESYLEFLEGWSSLVYGTGFENQRRESVRGFESLTLRQV